MSTPSVEKPETNTVVAYTDQDHEGVCDIYAQHYSEEEIAHVFTRINDSSVQTIVAHEGDEVVGVCVFRAPHEKLMPFAKTAKPLELYSLYAKERRGGAGKIMVTEMFKRAKEQGYTEVVVASADRWQTSWGFYDKMGFTRIGQLTEPNGELLQIWTKEVA